MAKMGGCNYEFNSAKEAQGKNTLTPSTFARNNMSKGGVNKHSGGSDKWDGKPGYGAGKADMVKAK